MKIKDIAAIIENKFPKRFAMDRDNVGLIVGDENSHVSRVLVCCDVDEYVAREAVEKNVQLRLADITTKADLSTIIGLRKKYSSLVKMTF